MKVTRRMIQMASLQLAGKLDRKRSTQIEELLQKIKAAPPMTPDQIAEQRVSFVYGQLASTGITKDQVRAVLNTPSK